MTTIPRQLKGIGYRVRLTEAHVDRGVVLTFEVGRSHPVLTRLRPGIRVTVDPTGVALTLEATGSVTPRRLGQEADRLRRIRPRSPYTGVGVLRADRAYPGLKSTKKSTKK